MDRDFFLSRKVDLPAETRWYQFTLRRIIGATTWMALWCGAIAIFMRGSLPSQGALHTTIWLSLLGMLFLAPFIAVGTLVGHPYRAFAIGVLLSLLGAMLYFCAGFPETFRVATAWSEGVSKLKVELQQQLPPQTRWREDVVQPRSLRNRTGGASDSGDCCSGANSPWGVKPHLLD